MLRNLLFITAAFVIALSGSASAQTARGTLRGTVSDPSGAVVPGAVVTLKPASGSALTTTANPAGEYRFASLPAGAYSMTATAAGFTNFEKTDITVASGRLQTIDVQLQIKVQEEQVQVESEANNVSVAPDNNASSLVLKGKDLEALSDDPDELQSELEALAGPSAGPNGGQIYIDGFTGGQLPPKSAIREIRINQNPFSAEFDKLGYGRIEILTKPGTDQFHGQGFFNLNHSAFNSTNPFLHEEPPPYHSDIYNANLGGPISKRASFFISAQRRNINQDAVVNAVVLDENFNPVTFTQAVTNPRIRTSITPRVDVQVTPNNTLTMRYQFTQVSETNDSVGQFALPSLATNLRSTENTFQLSDSQVINPHVVNETRFQYMRIRNDQNALNNQPEVSVLDTFIDGGNPIGILADHEDNFELQNTTQMVHGKHTVKFGGRLRYWDVRNTTTQNFNGTFTFSSLAAFQTTERGLQQGLTDAQIRALGGGASQFSIVTGQPFASVRYTDAGIFASDDFQLRPNLTLSYGLRFETQSGIDDHGDLAPRVALAWGIGKDKKSPKTVLRAGSGIFYDRFGDTLLLNAERLDGTNQEQLVVQNPDFFSNIPPAEQLTASGQTPTVYQIDPRLHAPYTIQSAISVERQVTKHATASITYLNSRGTDQFLTRNINAPLPGTFIPDDPTSGIRPLGNIGNVYQYASEGVFRQNQLITNYNVRLGTKLSLFGFYTLNYANADTAGASSFPSDQYNIALDYGRAAFDVRHRAFLGATVGLPYGVRLSPLLVASSGSPYNVTIGRDLNGDSIFNDRPGVAGGTGSNFVTTNVGTFDPTPIPGQQLIPMNFATGPGQFTMNLRVSKSFGFGPEIGGNRQTAQHGGGPGGPGGGGGGRPGGLGGRGLSGAGGGRGIFDSGSTGRRYSLTLSVYARNIFNNVNPALPIGTLTSPLFGQSNALAGFGGNSAANRRIDLLLQFSF
jgi:hypothetical protein